MSEPQSEVTEEQAREVLGLDADKWTIQFTDEELRMLQDVMDAEKRRRDDLFDGLFEKIIEIG